MFGLNQNFNIRPETEPIAGMDTAPRLQQRFGRSGKTVPAFGAGCPFHQRRRREQQQFRLAAAGPRAEQTGGRHLGIVGHKNRPLGQIGR